MPSHMERELGEIPRICRQQRQQLRAECERLAELIRARKPRLVMTVARGSSDHAATFAKYLIETRVGLAVASAAPSVASVYDARLDLEPALLIALSQSGKSPDLLRQQDLARQTGALTLAMVNDASSPLARGAEHVLAIGAGEERSVAATKSYIATLSVLIQLVASWSGDEELERAHARLPERLEQALELDVAPFARFVVDLDRLWIVGRGFGFAIALEVALKLAEAAALFSSAHSAAELFHGPLSLVGPGFPILVVNPPDVTSNGVEQVTRRLRSLGANVFTAEPGDASDARLGLPDADHPVTDAVVAIAALQLAVARAAELRGCDPDRPRHLSKITETK